MTTAQSLWLMVSIQLGIFGAIWLAIPAHWNTSSVALRRFGTFNIGLATGLLLIALRGRLPGVLTHVLADGLILWSCVVLWSGLNLQLRLASSLRWPMAVAAAATTLAGALYLVPALNAWRVGVVLATVAILVVGMAVTVANQVETSVESGMGRIFALASWAVGLFMATHAIGVAYWGWTAAFDLDSLGTLTFTYVTVGAASLINGMLAYLALRDAIFRLERMSRHDALTGLLNRRGFDEARAQAWDRWRRTQRPFAVLCIDIDHFKQVNDNHGHLAGDEVLTQVSAVVQQQLRKVDVLARTGGDELVAILDGQEQAADLEAAGRRIGEAVRALRVLPRLPDVQLSVSIGAAAVRAQDDAPERVLARADKALYEVKVGGRDGCRVVTQPPHAVELGAVC